MPRGGKRPNAGRKRTKPAKPAKVQVVESSAIDAPEIEETAAESTAGTLDNPFGLTPKELLFVTAYTGAALGNATKSYELAGYAGYGGTRRSNACKLLTKDRIARAIAARLAERVQVLDVMDGDEALRRITVKARADIGQVLGPDDPLSQLPPDVRATIKAVRPSRYGRSIELYDSMHAAEVLAKAAGKLVEKHEHKHKFSLEDIVAGPAEASV